jgi:pyruvate/2-oxoglutarate dehydrogenase complex dihydrolipoamide acyltransferase (E2) component
LEVSVEVPQIEGLRAEAATVVRWMKKEGEKVRKDETLLIVEFPKAEIEISAPASGKLTRILAEEGRMVRIHEKVGILQT